MLESIMTIESTYIILACAVLSILIILKVFFKILKHVIKIAFLFTTITYIGLLGYTQSPYIREFTIKKAFEIAPTIVRNEYIYKLKKDDLNITLLGTFGDQHLTAKDYSLHHLQAFMKNTKSDLIVVQTLEESIKEGDLSAGRVDMPYIYEVSKVYNIDCIGLNIDYQNERIDNYKLAQEIINIVSYYTEKKDFTVFLDYKSIKFQVEALLSHGFVKSKIDKGQSFNTNKVEYFVPKQYYDSLAVWTEVCVNDESKSFISCSLTDYKKRVNTIKKILKNQNT